MKPNEPIYLAMCLLVDPEYLPSIDSWTRNYLLRGSVWLSIASSSLTK